MNRREAIAWIETVCCDLRASQAKTLGHLVSAAMLAARISLAEIGRRLIGTSAKHGIKRTWRFTNNHRFEISDAMAGVIRRLLKRKRKKPLVIGFDWVEVRNFHTLAACAVLKGRAVPLLWASYPEWELAKSQNNLEEGLLRLLRTLIPEKTSIILLADRGFGRTELARTCQELGLCYLIRIRPDVWIETENFRGNLAHYPVKKGLRRLLRCRQYRRHDPVEQNVVVYWKKNLPKKRDECWFLMTNLDRSPAALVKLYGQRMTIEQVFRDHKSRRNGFALRNIQIQKASRFDRLLLILALAYLLLIGLGLQAKRDYCPSNWCTNTRDFECSVFIIGQRMLDRIEVSPEQAITALQRALTDAAPNWG
jgi:DDE family transposase